jgi:hypothetical protein
VVSQGNRDTRIVCDRSRRALLDDYTIVVMKKKFVDAS